MNLGIFLTIETLHIFVDNGNLGSMYSIVQSLYLVQSFYCLKVEEGPTEQLHSDPILPPVTDPLGLVNESVGRMEMSSIGIPSSDATTWQT